MSNRVKEDEKNERIIRGLLKLPENRRCINCNSLGPQYVCTNFWTFICTTCSGIHREFTHRVKSVSMAKFTSQEVTALQEGGNQRARDIYLKEWDPQRQSAPDSSNVDRLRDFIKHVYVDRRYTGERGRPLGVKMGEREDPYENRRTDSYQGGSRSPPYDETYDRRYNERSSPGGRSDDKYSKYSYDERRSPGYEQETRQYNDHTKSPVRLEIINDWRREDRFGNGRKVEDRRMSDGDSKLEGRSPERPKEQGASSPPMVRPVREILGDNVVPLRIGEPPKANVVRSADGSVQTQRTASSSSLGSTNGNVVEVKVENTRSLIDFDADPEPPVAAAVAQPQQAAAPQQPTSATDNNNWASFDLSPEIKASQASANANPLDSVLSELSVPASGPGSVSKPAGAGVSLAAPSANAAVLPVNGACVSAAAPGLAPAMFINGGNSFVKAAEAGQWPGVQHQQPLSSASGGQSTAQQFTAQFVGASGNQPWHSNVQAPLGTTFLSTPQVVVQPTVPALTTTGATSVVETKSSGRTELPADLFTSTYSSYPAAMPGWGPPHGMGFAMPHNIVAVPGPTFHQPSKSANPFDVNEPVQAQSFPSMVSLQASLPNVPPPSALQRTSSLGAPSHSWMPSQSPPFPSALPSQASSYVSALPPRAYMAQQGPVSMPPSGHQVMGSFGTERPTFGGGNMDQQVAGRYSAPPTPQPFSYGGGGNPFG